MSSHGAGTERAPTPEYPQKIMNTILEACIRESIRQGKRKLELNEPPLLRLTRSVMREGLRGGSLPQCVGH
jgi:hypothetical protein